MDGDMRKAYARLAGDYDRNRGAFDMTEVLESFYRRLDTRHGTLLDLGCGAGEPFARWFVDRGWEVSGVDGCPEMLDLARNYVPEMQLVCEDMRKLKYGDGIFDAVTCVYSLFHIPADDQFALLANIFNWLRPGGKLLFTYATREYTGEETFSGWKEFMGERLFYSHRTPEELKRRLQEIGFVVNELTFRAIGGETFLWVTATKADAS
ncbi:class I SAM-dependent methyltransferase [Kiritimatiella glycovorans]|uniref:Malonyl-CoA O-methyltransferase BioC n=1 Tax=Kiritimatiella glycovorans TaxID=1307763 RepID=A0A0G3EGU6_9BACT|nr:class I SAM-dependent methyltransferase [Kiritimatiella glycovorans]AKJ64647.1 Malonyl-CoA O-methyltransferase BioC [Kiritimatiella glycovorans]